MHQSKTITMNTLTDSTHVTTFGNSFNKNVYSDCKIIFKKSKTTLQLHKFVICQQSLFFETCFASTMIEGLQSTIEIEEEEDERLLTDLLRAMYTSKLTIKEPEDIVPLLLLAKKYEITPWIPQLDEYLSKNI